MRSEPLLRTRPAARRGGRRDVPREGAAIEAAVRSHIESFRATISRSV